MSKKEKNYMPQSGAGLMRFDDDRSAIRIKPEYVIIVSASIGVLLFIMNYVF